MILPKLEALARALPLEDAVRIELRDGVPMFRATPRIQGRIEELLEKQAEDALSQDDERELDRYEALDEFLSLVNRLVRNSTQPGDQDRALARTA
jgi:hypothetical protein